MSDASTSRNVGTSRRFNVSPLIVAAVFPLCISWYTTSEGMYQIFPDLPIISRLVAAVVIGVFAFMSNQVGVALASLKSNQQFVQTTAFARGVDIGLRGGLFAVLFFFALFFSFKFYYGALYNGGQREIDAETLPSVMSSSALSSVRGDMNGVGESFTAAGPIRSWSDGVTAIAQSVSSLRSQIVASIAQQSGNNATALAQAAQIKQQLKSDLAQKVDLEAQINTAQSRLSGELKSLADAKTRMDKEQRGADGAKPGEAANWRKAKSDADGAQRNIDHYKSIIADNNQILFGSGDKGGLIREIATLNTQMAELESNGAVNGLLGSPDTLIDGLNDARRKFQETPSLKTFAAAVGACRAATAIVSQIKTDTKPVIPATSCDSQDARSALNSLGPRMIAFEAFENRCSSSALGEGQSAPTAGAGRPSAEQFEAAQASVKFCLATAEDAGVDVSTARARFDSFVEFNSPHRDPTTMAVDGLLFQRGPVQAGMAYAFALAQEMLILALSFFAEWQRPSANRARRRPDLTPVSTDSTDVAAAKAILAHRQAVPESSRLFKVDLSPAILRDVPENIRLNARDRLLDLVLAELARAGQQADEFYLGADAMVELEQVILLEQTDVAKPSYEAAGKPGYMPSHPEHTDTAPGAAPGPTGAEVPLQRYRGR
jgi:hypothetical protein